MQRYEVWRQLYTYADEWVQLKPWEVLWSNDFVALEINEKTYYCTIMGKLGDCIGVSIYEGEEGYADLCSIAHEYPDQAITQYMMFEQNCLTFYMGDREEVPKGQKEIIKKLGLKYRGKGHWPYFLSFVPRFYPYEINDQQASVIVQVFKHLIPLMKAYMNHEVAVDFDNGEILFAHDHHGWKYEAIQRPEEQEKFYVVDLEDQQYLNYLKELPQTQNQYIIDLAYLSGGFIDERYDRPVSSLVLLVMDLLSQEIINIYMLKPEDDEDSICIQQLSKVIEKFGKPQEIFVRNPRVYSSLVSICDICQIDVHITSLPMMDDVLGQMESFMQM